MEHFGEATVGLTDRVELTGGLRWYDFSEDRTQVFDGIFADPNDSVGTVSADGFAPRVILSYQLSDATRLNAQVSKGFRLGGLNDPLNRPLCQPEDLAIYDNRPTWEDETLWNYEVGAKSTLGGGRGLINASIYYMDINDLQATVTAGSCSSRVVFNVPKAHSTGIELEATWRPNDSLEFGFAGTAVEAEFDSTVRDGAGNVLAALDGE